MTACGIAAGLLAPRGALFCFPAELEAKGKFPITGVAIASPAGMGVGGHGQASV